MRIDKLFQFRNPLFWIFVVLNLLSTVISWLLRTYEFPLLITLILAGFALGNMLFGIRIALRLMKGPDSPGR